MAEKKHSERKAQPRPRPSPRVFREGFLGEEAFEPTSKPGDFRHIVV